MKQRLYAFWEYDQYPFLLGAEIVKFCTNESGYRDFVQVKGYGGFLFKPIKICSLEQGKRIQIELDILRKERAKELVELENKYKAKLERIFP